MGGVNSGRKPAKDPLNIVKLIRMNEKTAAKLARLAKRHKTTEAAFIRHLIDVAK